MKWSGAPHARRVSRGVFPVVICAVAAPTRGNASAGTNGGRTGATTTFPHRSPRRIRITRAAISIVLAASIVATGWEVRAHDSGAAHVIAPHLRTTDSRLRAVLADGIASSPTLRALVSQLEQSDVVVYLEHAARPLAGVAGRLTFVSAQGGARYVVVYLACVGSRSQQLAILAHELQHAVEIAEDPSIVDEPSMSRAYTRIGYVNRWMTSAVAFDTKAARDIEERVRVEVSRRGRTPSRSESASPARRVATAAQVH
jgi:hypothetical protein